MTQDEIIEMARPRAWYGKVEGWTFNSYEELEAFAKLVAEREREACAKLVEESSLPDTYSQECLPEIANDIRARVQA
jgi:hypothetical protein